jgi:hypothetical protein
MRLLSGPLAHNHGGQQCAETRLMDRGSGEVRDIESRDHQRKNNQTGETANDGSRSVGKLSAARASAEARPRLQQFPKKAREHTTPPRRPGLNAMALLWGSPCASERFQAYFGLGLSAAAEGT